MARQPNESTQLRTLKRNLRDAQASEISWRQTAQQAMTRAKAAEQQAADWQARFDLLLKKAHEFKVNP